MSAVFAGPGGAVPIMWWAIQNNTTGQQTEPVFIPIWIVILVVVTILTGFGLGLYAWRRWHT